SSFRTPLLRRADLPATSSAASAMLASICTTTVQVSRRRPGAVARAGAGPRAPRPAAPSGPVDNPGPGSGAGPVRHAVPLHRAEVIAVRRTPARKEDRQFHPAVSARSEASALRQPTGSAAGPASLARLCRIAIVWRLGAG